MAIWKAAALTRDIFGGAGVKVCSLAGVEVCSLIGVEFCLCGSIPEASLLGMLSACFLELQGDRGAESASTGLSDLLHCSRQSKRGELDGLTGPINAWVVLREPWEAKDNWICAE